MARAVQALSLLVHHPRLFCGKAKGRLLASLYSKSKARRRRKINGVLFEFPFDYDPMIASMYFGGYERETVSAMERFLRPGDTFIDVGANIGYLSTLALGLVGETGQVHSFEPVPDHFQRLQAVEKLHHQFTQHRLEYDGSGFHEGADDRAID